MKAYDLHVHSAFSIGESTLEQLAQTAKALGYSGICFAVFWKNKRQMEIIGTDIERVEKLVGIEILLGFEAENLKELRKLAELRREYDILIAHGGYLEMNRAAVETPEVDILAHPELDRNDSGLNHVLVKLAQKNNIAIELNFREILVSNGYMRAKVLKNMRQNVMLAKKYHAPIILCSRAISHFELRDPYSMMSMAVQLGLELNQAKDCISKVPERIIKQAKLRTSENWVMPGVKVVK